FFFFFQAEDGIRDFHVTGVQTCALPISGWEASAFEVCCRHYQAIVEALVADAELSLAVKRKRHNALQRNAAKAALLAHLTRIGRSEERRVGKERTARVALHHMTIMTMI